MLTIALAGNPNCGKTTVFNNLTGARQHVANYPGVTVSIKEGICRRGDETIRVVDLPGTYSLNAFSPEEVAARSFLLERPPDVIVNVVDASTLERNLYLTTQLVELGVPIVLALNMTDVARTRGIDFDLDRLERLLGIPIVPMVGAKNEGTHELIDTVVNVARGARHCAPRHVDFGREIEGELQKIEAALALSPPHLLRVPPRWVALRLLEGDQGVAAEVPGEARRLAESAAVRLQRLTGSSVDMLLADRRYGFVSGACQEAVCATAESRHNLSDAIDAVATSSFGVVLFFCMMYLVFFLVFRVAAPMTRSLSVGFGLLERFVASHWPQGADPEVRDLLVRGVIGGVGGVLALLPNVLLLFLAIAILEDSGYMARAAFVMDRFMHRIGLHGKSFIPLVLGFGCTVPAVLATRILENPRDRLTTMLVAPLMSCGARFAVYSLLIPAFFPLTLRAPVLWALYLTGIALALAGAKLLRSTILSGESTPLVMELPPYRLPTIRGLLLHMWERGGEYVKKAGTVILAVSIVLWAMTTYPKPPPDPQFALDRAEAERRLEAGLSELGSSLGVQTDARTLRVFLEASPEAGWADTALIPPESASVLARFAAMLDEVREVRERTRRSASARREVTSPIVHDAALTRLRQLDHHDPALSRLSIWFLDEVETPYREAIERIEVREHEARLRHSIAGRWGRFVEPVLRPLGFDWRIATAFLGSLAAREAFVAQMSLLFAVGVDHSSDELQARLGATYPPLAGFNVMLVLLVGSPCLPALVVTYRESRSLKWPLLQVALLTATAYLLALALYQAGSVVGLGTRIGG